MSSSSLFWARAFTSGIILLCLATIGALIIIGPDTTEASSHTGYGDFQSVVHPDKS